VRDQSDACKKGCADGRFIWRQRGHVDDPIDLEARAEASYGLGADVTLCRQRFHATRQDAGPTAIGCDDQT
jgi:hypothetical protein